jgi:Flp pilus assembly protein TadG
MRWHQKTLRAVNPKRGTVAGEDLHGEEGQSLLETAVTMPLLLAIAFNLINVAYFWVVVLSLSAAARQGVQYASQGGTAAATISAPTTAAVSNLVYENLTNAINDATTSNVAVRVCSTAKGVNSATGVALCDQFGPAFTFSGPPADPESPVYVLNRVDVAFTVTPVIPGTVFGVLLPSNLQFQRHASMRSLY